ncbi:MAG: band 7 protein [Frankiales bacterium]|nr:band 7 protein [Frankiales bacterium]
MIYILSAVGGALVLAIVLFKLMWRVAEPDEALVISGLHASSEEGLGFKVVTGKGTLVIPGVQAVRRLSLDLREAELAVDCVTTQGIPVSVKGVVIFKVGDDMHSIGNAARRFLDQQSMMETRVHNVFAGHLRAIVGQITMEEMIRDREKLTALTRQSSGIEMEKLGLIVDSLQIQEIDDPTGYIENLGRPYAAAVASAARIAQADADREATEREQVAEALKAEAVRNSQIKQYGFQAEIDESAARAEQAGPLADAAAKQEVVRTETKVAELEAQKAEQTLQATVRKPADAQAYHDTTLAKAARDARISAAEAHAKEVELQSVAAAKQMHVQADAIAAKVKVEALAQAQATKALGDAEAHSVKVKGDATASAAKAQGLAEAAAIKARGEALAENQDAVIGQTLAESWPQVVAAAAAPFGEVEHMVMLNGATGIADVMAQAMTQGAAGLGLVRSLLGKQQPVVPPSAEVVAQNGTHAAG